MSTCLGRFGKGYRPDPEHRRSAKRGLAHLIGTSFAVPAKASLRQFAPPVQDQKTTSECTGFAFRRAIDTRLGFDGVAYEPHSCQGIYTIGRCLQRARMPWGPSEPLADDGAIPSDVAEGCAKGVPTEKAWPFDPATVNDDPRLDEMLDAARFVVKEIYRIEAVGSDRVRAVMAAIAAGYPVVFGTEVDQRFEDYDGRDLVLPSLPGRSLGGHMLCGGLEYETLPSGTVVFGGDNSWGTDNWGDRGTFRYGEEFLADPQLDDLYAVEIGERGAP